MKRLVVVILYILISIFIYEFTFAQVPHTISITPSFNQIAANTQPTISVTFNIPMDSTTFNRISFAVFGERSGFKEGTISYNNINNTVSFTPITKFNAGERVTASLARGILALAGDSLSGFAWTIRIPSKPVGLNFSKPVVYGGGGDGMQCIDMNNDGFPDIITSSGVILLNNGSGQFNSSWILPDADRDGDIAIADFNRDGFMDVLYKGSNGLKIGLGDGSGNFTISTMPFWFFRYAIADFNNDGYPDIAGINRIYGTNPPYSDTLSYWSIALNNGTGYFKDTTVIDIHSGWFRGIATSEIDNDGDIDIIIISQHAVAGDIHGFDGMIVFKNDGKGIFNQYELYPVGNYFDISAAEFLCSADFNNDNFADIAIMADFSGTILLNSGSSTFINDSAHTRTFWGAEQISPFTSGDINGDGWVDIVKSGYKFPPEMPITYYAVQLNKYSYFVGGLTDTLPDVLIHAVAAADLDGDGDMDLVHSGDGVFITLNKDTVTSVNNNFKQPKGFSLHQNFPNPFNGETIISFQLLEKQKVTIKIFNILGEEVKTLKDEIISPGAHKVVWNGADDRNVVLPSGIYFIRLQTNKSFKITKAVLIK